MSNRKRLIVGLYVLNLGNEGN